MWVECIGPDGTKEFLKDEIQDHERLLYTWEEANSEILQALDNLAQSSGGVGVGYGSSGLTVIIGDSIIPVNPTKNEPTVAGNLELEIARDADPLVPALSGVSEADPLGEGSEPPYSDTTFARPVNPPAITIPMLPGWFSTRDWPSAIKDLQPLQGIKAADEVLNILSDFLSWNMIDAMTYNQAVDLINSSSFTQFSVEVSPSGVVTQPPSITIPNYRP